MSTIRVTFQGVLGIRHMEWNGWSPADLISPSFLFLVGASVVFACSARLDRGESRGTILLHALKRSLILIAVGLFVNSSLFVGVDWRAIRSEGVTQWIGLCYFAAVVLFLWTNRWGQIAVLVGLLVGYWAMFRFLPVPGFGAPGREVPFMDQHGNIAASLDRKAFMGHLYDGYRDPDGIISTITATATTISGMLAGWWLRSGREPRTIVGRLLAFGIVGLVTGEVWNRWFPINKNVWTSSFVVLGMNAIAGFVMDSLAFSDLYSPLRKW